MKTAFEKWVELTYGDSLMVPCGAVAAWNAAVRECRRTACAYSTPIGGEIARQLDTLVEDFHSEGD